MSNGSRSADAPRLQRGGSCRRGGRAPFPHAAPLRGGGGRPPATPVRAGLFARLRPRCRLGSGFPSTPVPPTFPIFVSFRLALSFPRFCFRIPFFNTACTQKVPNKCWLDRNGAMVWAENPGPDSGRSGGRWRRDSAPLLPRPSPSNSVVYQARQGGQGVPRPGPLQISFLLGQETPDHSLYGAQRNSCASRLPRASQEPHGIFFFFKQESISVQRGYVISQSHTAHKGESGIRT